MKPSPPRWPRISSAVYYDDPAGAIDWLCKAFGFEVRLKVVADDGSIAHSELTFGEGVVMVEGRLHGLIEGAPERSVGRIPRTW